MRPLRPGLPVLLSLLMLLPALATITHASDQAITETSAIDIPAQPEPLPALHDMLSALAQGNFSEKRKLVDRIAEAKHPGSHAALDALLDNRLYYDKDSGRALMRIEQQDTHFYVDAASGAPVDVQSANAKRVTTNNGLRSQLRSALARFDLDDADATIRLRAVKQLRNDIDASTAALLRQQLSTEQDEDIIEQMEVALALHDLDDLDSGVRLAAVQRLDGELGNDVYNRLASLVDNEQDSEVRKTAAAALKRIEGKRSFFSGLETTFFGLSFGSVLVLSAIGLAITFGVMGVINMAHGEMMMLGAYTTFVLQHYVFPDNIALSIVLSIPAAFLVAGAVGIAIERGIVRFLYGRPLETLLATFGVSLVLQQLVRSIFGSLNQSVQTPEFMSGLWQINEIFAITYNRLYILIFTLIVFVGLLLILNKTSLGLKVRAVSQNRQMAKALGVRTDRVDALTFGLGSGVAGIAGVALSQLTNVGPNLGQGYIIDSFMVVVFGGVGNLWGTLIGGFGLGIFNKLLEPWAGAVLAKILILVFIILFIQRHKQGLFPHKGRAAEDH